MGEHITMIHLAGFLQKLERITPLTIFIHKMAALSKRKNCKALIKKLWFIKGMRA